MNNSADVRHWLFEEFSSRLAIVFETMTGERPAIDIDQVPELPPAFSTLRWRQPFTGVPGAAWGATSTGGWKAAGGHVLRAAGIEESDAASLKSTYLETLNQAFSGIASAMGGRVGREVNCEGGEESTAAASDASWAVLRVLAGVETAEIAIGFEEALVAAMIVAPPAEKIEPPRTAETAVAAAAGAGEIAGPVNSKTFELLLDVELPISVSFGRAQVPLKEVLKLTTGSIVELNRSILEPVEVIVNNCVIARGEVVVVEGNFGVRVHQVVSRQERLRTLN